MLTLWRYAAALHRLRALVVLTTAVADGVLAFGAPVLLGHVVGGLPSLSGGPSAGFIVTLTALIILVPISNVLPRLADLPREYLDAAAESDMVLRMGVGSALSPSLASVEDPGKLASLSLMRHRQGEIQDGLQIALVQIPTMAVTAVGCAVALALDVQWWLPALLLFGGVVQGWVNRLIGNHQAELWRGLAEPVMHAEHTFELSMGGAAKELRIFDWSNYFGRRYWNQFTEAYGPFWRKRRYDMAADLTGGLVRTLVGVAAIAYIGTQAAAGQLSFTELATALPLVMALSLINTWPLHRIGHCAECVRQLDALCTLDACRELTELAFTSVRTDLKSVSVPPAAPPEVVFDDVTFSYSQGSAPVLSALTVTFGAGAAVALVGLNGAGKSTLVKLLTGGYRPNRGQVLVDDVDLATLSDGQLHAWQRRIAPVIQDFARPPLLAGDIVALGSGKLWAGQAEGTIRPDTASLDRIAARAGLRDLIDGLPAGWSTPLSTTWPSGRDLSGGEWQRMALGRALAAVDAGAGLLVLDEPAAALDVVAEARLISGYLDLTSRVTSIVISHRFSVVRSVPTICVLAHGRIAELGSHEELIAAGGSYAALFSLQADRYRQEYS